MSTAIGGTVYMAGYLDRARVAFKAADQVDAGERVIRWDLFVQAGRDHQPSGYGLAQGVRSEPEGRDPAREYASGGQPYDDAIPF